MKPTEIGAKAEQLAAHFLAQKGYEIVCTNYRFKKSEIDIIALHMGCLVFVEVKMRKNALFGYPEQFVTPRKQQQIRKAADEYIFTTHWQHNIRFDIIAITGKLSSKQVDIQHFEDVF